MRNISRAKAQRKPWKRGSALRLCAFARETFPSIRQFLCKAGTWWIPLLLALGFWRHVYKRFPLRYDPQYWGMVFPFGMYTVCTFQLVNAINFPRLMVIPQCFVYLALAGWIAASLGLLANLVGAERVRGNKQLNVLVLVHFELPRT